MLYMNFMVTTNQKPIIHTKRKNPGVKLKPSITKEESKRRNRTQD